MSELYRLISFDGIDKAAVLYRGVDFTSTVKAGFVHDTFIISYKEKPQTVRSGDIVVFSLLANTPHVVACFNYGKGLLWCQHYSSVTYQLARQDAVVSGRREGLQYSPQMCGKARIIKLGCCSSKCNQRCRTNLGNRQPNPSLEDLQFILTTGVRFKEYHEDTKNTGLHPV